MVPVGGVMVLGTCGVGIMVVWGGGVGVMMGSSCRVSRGLTA